MKCEIKWNILTLEEWQKRFATIQCSNILQQYEYAIAHAKTYRQSARWGVILMNGQEAGLVQVIEARVLWGVFHGLILDRGPLWFDGFGGAAHIKIFFEEFDQQFPKRFGRKRRILPEIEEGSAALGVLKQTGLNRIESQTGYQSLWWDLDIEDDEARQALKNNWRGSLKKAEQSNLDVRWDDTGKFYLWLRQQYSIDKAVRGYNGISPKLLDNMVTVSTSHPNMIIGKVRQNGQDIAGVLILLHGQSATYQIGWSSNVGRAVNAHHLLLWQARKELKDRDIKGFDLGGVNDEASTAGIKSFKQGTGAVLYRLVGQYE